MLSLKVFGAGNNVFRNVNYKIGIQYAYSSGYQLSRSIKERFRREIYRFLQPRESTFSSTGSNPYFILKPGYRLDTWGLTKQRMLT